MDNNIENNENTESIERLVEDGIYQKISDLERQNQTYKEYISYLEEMVKSMEHKIDRYESLQSLYRRSII